MFRDSGNSRCWSCSNGRNSICENVLVELYGGEFLEYRRLLRGGEAEDMGLLHLEFEDDEDEFVDDSERVFVGWEWPPTAVDHEDPLFERGRAYLASRGINDDVIRKYDIRFSPGENRVLFPYVIDGELVGWQGRLCGSDRIVDTLTGITRTIPKALTKLQEGIQSHYVMFSQNLQKSAHAVLTEGPISGLKTDLCGGSVTTLGKGVTENQLKWVADRVKRVYLALDSDAGDDMTRAANFLMGRNIEVYLMRVPEHVIERLAKQNKKADLGDCTFEEAYGAFMVAQRWEPGQIAMSIDGELIF